MILHPNKAPRRTRLSASYFPWHSVRAVELGRQTHPAKGEVNIEITDQQLLAVSASYSQTVHVRNGQIAGVP